MVGLTEDLFAELPLDILLSTKYQLEKRDSKRGACTRWQQ